MKIGTMVEVVETISTVNGSLHKGDIVRIEEASFPDSDYRVSSELGVDFYVQSYQINVLNAGLSKKQMNELQSLTEEMVTAAKDTVDDYKDNPSQLSGSYHHVHQNSPALSHEDLKERIGYKKWI